MGVYHTWHSADSNPTDKTEPKKEINIPTQQINLQIHLFVDEHGKIIAASEEEGEKVVINRAAVKASSRTCVKKSEGEILIKKIKNSMDLRGITTEYLAKKTGIGKTTIYAYFKRPGTAPLSKMLSLCYAAGIQELTLLTGGTYK